MGTKAFTRETRTTHTGSCRSELQARRLYETCVAEQRCHDVVIHGLAVTFTDVYCVAGNWSDDQQQLQERLARRANVHVDWAAWQSTRVTKDKPRPLSEIIRSVERARGPRAPIIEGSAAVPAGPIKAQLRELGYMVR